jgi:transcriptional regulator with XRE-family HTH domain
MAKLFYVKWHVEDGILILDQLKKKTSSKEILVVPNRITKAQGKRLKERITDRYLYKKRNPFVNEIEHEFHSIFHTCKQCGYVTDREKVNKAWGDLCNICFRKLQQEKLKEYQANKDYRKKVRKLKKYLQTTQGKIDAVPLDVIESNVRMEVVRQGKTMRELAKHLNISDSKMSLLFSGKKLDSDDLEAICEYLMTPMELFLRLPRGVYIKRQDGIPKHWLEEDFRMKNE